MRNPSLSESPKNLCTSVMGRMLGVTSAFLLSAVVVPPLVMVPSKASAQLYEAGAKARVNRASDLETLSEAIASAGCRLNGDIEASVALAELKTDTREFGLIVDGLQNGSAPLGLPAPRRSARLITAMEELVQVWDPMADAALQLQNAQGGPEADLIREARADLYDRTSRLHSIEAGYSATQQEILQSDALLLNFALRQRTLAHRMVRAACELVTGTGSASTQQELEETLKLFDQTMVALRDGFPAAGISPPPNEDIRAALEAAYEVWTRKRQSKDGTNAKSPETVAESARLAAELDQSMRNIVTLYMIALRGNASDHRPPVEAYTFTELVNWINDPFLIDAVKNQNVVNADLSMEEIEALNLQWVEEANAGDGPLLTSVLSNETSDWLIERMATTAGLVVDVMVIDNRGLNVGQFPRSSDYWQADEFQWSSVFGNDTPSVVIGDVYFDESSRYYQAPVYKAVSDPETGEVIGTVSFGIRVQNLM